MDKDRIEGAAKQAKGAVKEAVRWRAMPSCRPKARPTRAEGKLQNAVGGLKDTLRQACAG